MEWALVGAVAALLFVAGHGQLRARPLAIALALFVLSGWLTPRVVGRALRPAPPRSHPTVMTLAGLAATSVVLAAAYWAMFQVILAEVD